MPFNEELVRELKRAVAIKQMHGANSPTNLEWWYFTGHLWKVEKNETCESQSTSGQKPPHYGIQATFFLSDKNSPRGLLAHSAEADLKKGTHGSAEFAVALSEPEGASPLALVEKKFLNLTLGHWRLNQMGVSEKQLKWDLRFDVKGTEYLLQLDIPKDKIWFHGKNGYVQKTDATGNFYYSIPFIQTRGLRISRDSSKKTISEAVCGQIWFDHEIHVEKVLDVGWQWFGLSFSNQKALMFYDIKDKKKLHTPQGEIWDQRTGKSAPLEDIKISSSHLKCLASERCYPQTFSISFTNPWNKKRENVETRSAFAEQEVVGQNQVLSRIYWEGSTHASWIQENKTTKQKTTISDGIGFTELVPEIEKK